MTMSEDLGAEDGVTATPPSSNGHIRGDAPIPSQEDVLLAMGRGSFLVAREMLTGSEKPSEYMIRSRWSREEIDTMKAMKSYDLEVYDGFIDTDWLIMWTSNALAGAGGQARHEAVEIATPMPLPYGGRGGLGNFSRRVRNPDGQSGG